MIEQEHGPLDLGEVTRPGRRRPFAPPYLRRRPWSAARVWGADLIGCLRITRPIRQPRDPFVVPTAGVFVHPRAVAIRRRRPRAPPREHQRERRHRLTQSRLVAQQTTGHVRVESRLVRRHLPSQGVDPVSVI